VSLDLSGLLLANRIALLSAAEEELAMSKKMLIGWNLARGISMSAKKCIWPLPCPLVQIFIVF